MISTILGIVVLAIIAYVVYVQFTKTPAEDSLPKRVIVAIVGAFTAAVAWVVSLFN